MPFGKAQSRFVDFDGERMNRQQAAQHGQQRMRVGPGRLHLPARDLGEFVEDLDADGAAFGDGRFGAVGLRGIAGSEVDEDIGVEKASGRSPRHDRT